jgi:hypothetical protein
MYIYSQVEYPLFLLDFNETLIFWTDFRKNLNIKFHEIRPQRAKLLHSDRHDNANSRFSQLANAPKMDLKAVHTRRPEMTMQIQQCKNLHYKIWLKPNLK